MSILSIFLAFALVLVLVPPARKLALRVGFVDAPGGRKEHEEPVPPIGGLVLFTVFMIIALLTGTDFSDAWPLFVALGLILFTGALDDYRHIDAWVKFGVQFLCAGLIVLASEARLYNLGDLFGFGVFHLGFMSIPFSIVAVVLFINAINLIDGLDGLAGGVSFIVLFWLAVACAVAGQGAMLLALLPLIGALAGFLFYNMRRPGRARASIFLGDAGSLGLGLVLAWFCIDFAQAPGPVVLPPIAVAWILALPIIDICAQFNRRVREGRHPFDPDRGHFHHHFIHAGLPVGRAVALILLICFILGGVGYFGFLIGLPQWVLTLVWIMLLFAHIGLSRKPQIYIDFLNQLVQKH